MTTKNDHSNRERHSRKKQITIIGIVVIMQTEILCMEKGSADSMTVFCECCVM